MELSLKLCALKTALAMAGTLRGFELPFGRKVMLLLSGGWSLGVAPGLYGPVVIAAPQPFSFDRTLQ